MPVIEAIRNDSIDNIQISKDVRREGGFDSSFIIEYNVDTETNDNITRAEFDLLKKTILRYEYLENDFTDIDTTWNKCIEVDIEAMAQGIFEFRLLLARDNNVDESVRDFEVKITYENEATISSRIYAVNTQSQVITNFILNFRNLVSPFTTIPIPIFDSNPKNTINVNKNLGEWSVPSSIANYRNDTKYLLENETENKKIEVWVRLNDTLTDPLRLLRGSYINYQYTKDIVIPPDPSTLFTNLVGWFDGESYSESLGEWFDKSDNNHTLTTISGKNKPIEVSNAINGLKAVGFGMSANARALEFNEALTHYSTNQNATYIFVIKFNTSTGNQRFYAEQNNSSTSNEQYLYLGSSATSIQNVYKATGSATQSISQSGNLPASYAIWVGRKYYTGNTSENETYLKKETTLISSTNTNLTGSISGTRTTIGYFRQHWNGTELWGNCEIAEMVISATNETDEAIAEVIDYLKEKYAL